MFEGIPWAFILTLLLLGASVGDDLRSRKVHNSLITSIFVVSLWSALTMYGISSLAQISTSMVGAIAFCLPLYLLRAFGGGDFKLMIAISPLLAWTDVGWTLAFSLVWGTILGLLMVVLRNELRSFLHNLFSLAIKSPVGEKSLHKVPFTVAIFFGFLTHWTLVQRGVSLL